VPHERELEGASPKHEPPGSARDVGLHSAPGAGEVAFFLRLQRIAGNAAVGRLLARAGGAAAAPAASPFPASSDPLVEFARAALRQRNVDWRGVATELLRRVVTARFATKAASVNGYAFDAEAVRGVQPVRGDGGLRLIASDTVVRWVANGFLEHLVADLSAAFRRDALEQAHNKMRIVDGNEHWSSHDVEDLEAAFGFLTNDERTRLREFQEFRIVRRVMIPEPDPDKDDPDARTSASTARCEMLVADGLFKREAGASGGSPIYGRPAGVHGIVHELGHAIEAPRRDVVLRDWIRIYNRLVLERKRISSEPKGNPNRHPNFEVLAEAFARYHTDAAGLQADDRESYDFFAHGKHLLK